MKVAYHQQYQKGCGDEACGYESSAVFSALAAFFVMAVVAAIPALCINFPVAVAVTVMICSFHNILLCC